MSTELQDFYEAAGIGTVNIMIDRDTVESGDATDFVHRLLTRYMADQTSLLTHRERLDFNWHGYDQDPRELFEIPEVIAFVDDLHARWPYALYFLSREGHGLHTLQVCLARAEIVREARDGVARIKLDANRMRTLMNDEWLPGLAHLCTRAGYDEQAVAAMTDSAVAYLYKQERRPSTGIEPPRETPRKPFVVGVGADIWGSGQAYDLVEALEAQTFGSAERMLTFRTGIELSWRGLEGASLWEIPEAVEFALDLDRRWPWAFFFLSRDGYALRDIACCVHVVGGDVGEHAAQVWLPALGVACHEAGLELDDFQAMADSALAYLRKHIT